MYFGSSSTVKHRSVAITKKREAEMVTVPRGGGRTGTRRRQLLSKHVLYVPHKRDLLYSTSNWPCLSGVPRYLVKCAEAPTRNPSSFQNFHSTTITGDQKGPMVSTKTYTSNHFLLTMFGLINYGLP